MNMRESGNVIYKIMCRFGYIYLGIVNRTKLEKRTKIKLNFINNRAYPISLEPKIRNWTENQISTSIFKIKIIYLQILIIFNF